ncbi:hypothetical protein K437DRAFT_50308 [Tilletiaria anomala UBC 951]|uniref:RING-type domain-containing protein n=1 Tax=Tilletiaria anomala (strain ATCC 24038 / CBS 436.72 / UBC 951) TaxID=1037660 RepID=A0A066WBU4_TILAU|nr:uncharacterized protein K437DRAFT_50308 [Tilletiaria anomala UBC 951]KDN51392.1 hypothetical protein K437DRAFT_50308 [Tilletiaria anomala UBC 951]
MPTMPPHAKEGAVISTASEGLQPVRRKRRRGVCGRGSPSATDHHEQHASSRTSTSSTTKSKLQNAGSLSVTRRTISSSSADSGSGYQTAEESRPVGSSSIADQARNERLEGSTSEGSNLKSKTKGKAIFGKPVKGKCKAAEEEEDTTVSLAPRRKHAAAELDPASDQGTAQGSDEDSSANYRPKKRKRSGNKPVLSVETAPLTGAACSTGKRSPVASRTPKGTSVPGGAEPAQDRLVDAMHDREKELQLQVTELQGLIKKHEQVIQEQTNTLNAVQSACTCHICLDSIWRPFVLVPCGHIFCLSCLVNWFQKPDHHEVSIPPHWSEGLRRDEEERRTRLRRKLCPECRTHVAQPPVELWSMKLVMDKMHAGAESMRTAARGEGLANLQALVSAEYGYEAGETAQQRDEKLGLTARLTTAQGMVLGKQLGVWHNIFPARDIDPSRPRFDEADRVYRCPECSAEMLDGECIEW